ncbi:MULTISPECIES: ATP-binding cassette domain-containing protein [unclassified Mucilaginibacter]|uniref:ATP-binding cassette domain-containing protein n=1 Tax=unclassified Mucilaginibacter TaxID=2617802 RepID=UPI002AC9D10B|nr:MULTISPECIES: ATP-binding cassette domain-containing protein [unclassified Mucilaginibacter]MEB0260911.1 ATP-binding cassette domain-containing protein [Mucilaginibacter sp. 10I4]MEB0279852.1 ATP-binding cassette domain-containing protein [Mucilaginibacter sp. 10B2]MEB0303212.1 ATP-binding cassette domain-containing protein [Mucilaginibacter sp. 5C4]WPX24177.1 ATP-binding cassette domain-containing protein [Mucilaginibacter sp. 5C4]
MIAVEIEKKLKAYNGLQLLLIKKAFTPASITRITGPSGAGKTTFLKMVAGLINPDSGTIKAGNTIWFDASQNINLSPQKRHIGFVFQDYALFPNMTVKEHLEYATNDTAWINRLLSIGGLETFTNHKPNHLSGGQQQRLAILRALATKPKLLLMDEPFSALDIKMKSALIKELQALFIGLGATALIVSHNPQELDGISTDELEVGDYM